MIKLSECIAPAFIKLHKSIKNNEYSDYWVVGGRGSTKSSLVSIQIILDIMKDSKANAVCMRKVAAELKDSVYSQIKWAIYKLGVQKYFTFKLSPLCIEYKATKDSNTQMILFRGLDKAEKSKSIKAVNGYFKNIWLEELTEFNGIDEVRTVIESLARGGDLFNIFYTYNPPISVNNWVNVECDIPEKGKFVHRSNYLDVPPEWLGKLFIRKAEHLKTVNELAYKHRYLGIATGTGGNIFKNIVSKEINDNLIKTFDNIKQGIDWGYAVDPFAYIKLHYDKTRKTIYLYDEIYKQGLLNSKAIELIKEKSDQNTIITADSAEPKSIDEFKSHGINIRGADKGKDSIRFGIKFLQDLEQIIIDPIRCPKAYKELINYELDRTKDGSFKDEYPDKNNHIIDALRYALESSMKSSNGIVKSIKIDRHKGYKKGF